MTNIKQHFNLKHFLFSLFALLLAAIVWLPSIHFLYKPDISEYRNNQEVPSKARMIVAWHLEIWTNSVLQKLELQKMQKKNPEWDFMSRTYFVLALANIALVDKKFEQKACEIIDFIIDNTIEIEKKKGIYHFLLQYGHYDSWELNPPRSIFIDGEIAIMLAARRLISEKPSYKLLLAERIELMIFRMKQSPVLSAESYPDECWLFCNTVALASIRMADALDGTDHSKFLSSWVDIAKMKLTDSKTGILISTFDVKGKPILCGFGPEGSTIWMACHMLQIINEKFAEDQYILAKNELFRSIFGFGYSREWPASVMGTADIDSGPIIPYVNASASASGLALIAASGFDDTKTFSTLITSLNIAGFPIEKNGKLYFQAGNPVGDAVLLYSMVEGPLWDKVKRRIKNEFKKM